jgi:hypothetical protein
MHALDGGIFDFIILIGKNLENGPPFLRTGIPACAAQEQARIGRLVGIDEIVCAAPLPAAPHAR